MALSRKHFIALADLCAEYNLNKEVIDAIASFCLEHGSSFDGARFRGHIATKQRDAILKASKGDV